MIAAVIGLTQATSADRRPNIILIYAYDQGYGDCCIYRDRPFFYFRSGPLNEAVWGSVHSRHADPELGAIKFEYCQPRRMPAAASDSGKDANLFNY